MRVACSTSPMSENSDCKVVQIRLAASMCEGRSSATRLARISTLRSKRRAAGKTARRHAVGRHLHKGTSGGASASVVAVDAPGQQHAAVHAALDFEILAGKRLRREAVAEIGGIRP